MNDRPSSVVSVGAHQDDELRCLGTLIRYPAQGCRITTVSLSNGDKGGQHDPSIPHAVIAQTRIDEAIRMVAELGGTYHCLGFEDGFVFDSREIRLKLTEVLRAVRADVVLTLPPTDYNNDHIIAGHVAQHASLLAAINVIHTESPPLAHAPTFRGQQCGVTYAEGFRPVLRTPLLRPGWVLPE